MFKLTIKTGNAAFHNDGRSQDHGVARSIECARILREIAEQLETRESGTCIDINGNNVGTWTLTAR